MERQLIELISQHDNLVIITLLNKAAVYPPLELSVYDFFECTNVPYSDVNIFPFLCCILNQIDDGALLFF